VGSVRVGVALSDPDGILATPVATVARTSEGEPAPGDADIEEIAGLVEEHAAVGVVVGLPGRFPVTKGPPQRGRASMLSWLRRASRRSGCVSSMSASPVSMRIAPSVRAASPAGDSAPWSTRPRPC